MKVNRNTHWTAESAATKMARIIVEHPDMESITMSQADLGMKKGALNGSIFCHAVGVLSKDIPGIGTYLETGARGPSRVTLTVTDEAREEINRRLNRPRKKRKLFIPISKVFR
ncbi:hypothetical protein LCGC14_0408250 [marine sediment metagenome]|uniref:Uncharacterized protein n=2 Tax=root TaxID=1 RepID=A0A7V1BGY1_9RHOB|nr:hypothetical protein [Sulfitobacter litoralis]HDZ53033.1 hypothetical protein [Sulfitobacter litoralis]